MPRFQQRCCLVHAEVLDAERTGQPEDDAAILLGAPLVGVVIGGPDVVRWFAVEDQRPAVQPRRLAAHPE